MRASSHTPVCKDARGQAKRPNMSRFVATTTRASCCGLARQLLRHVGFHVEAVWINKPLDVDFKVKKLTK